MKKLSDYALAGMPNIRKDLGLETEMQKNLRLQQEGLLMGRQFGGLPAPIASLAQGIAANVPSIRDNVRQLGVEKGLNLQTESELFDLAMSEYDGSPESQAKVVQSLTAINPEYGAIMADRLSQRNLQVDQINASIGRDQAQTAKLSSDALGLTNYRNLVKNLATNTKFENADFSNLNETALSKIFTELTEKQDFKLYHGVDAAGKTRSVFLNTTDNKYYSTQDPSIELKPEEVPSEIYNASIQTDSINKLSPRAYTDLVDSRVNTSVLMHNIDKVLSIVDRNPDALTTVSSFAATANSLNAEITAAKNIINQGGIDSKLFDPQSEEIKKAVQDFGFAGTGRDSAELNSLVIGLAYSAAAANQSSNSISNKDVALQMQRIGANQGDAKTFRTNLQNFATESYRKYSERYKALNEGEDPDDDFGLGNIMLDGEERKLMMRAKEL